LLKSGHEDIVYSAKIMKYQDWSPLALAQVLSGRSSGNHSVI